MKKAVTLEPLAGLNGVSTNYNRSESGIMSDYHCHDYYEISIILSGNLRVLTERDKIEGTGCKLTLLRPYSAHFVSVIGNDEPYERVNVNFTAEAVSEFAPRDANSLLFAFREGGYAGSISSQTAHRLFDTARKIGEESNEFRRRLLLLYLLSQISDLPENKKSALVPDFIGNAMSFVSKHYHEKIVAATVAWAVGVGRTTLMTAFKRYTGVTLNDYIVGYRLNAALKLLRSGLSQEAIAEKCGFADACSFARSFKSRYGLPPLKYLRSSLNC